MRIAPGSATLPTCTYHPLEQLDEILVISLAPQTGNAPIHCGIIHAQLYHRAYHALSYEWGQHDDTGPKIAVDNKYHVQVRANLHKALGQLRNGKETRYLWIDALSTHQEDIRERGGQVRMMGKIYQGASSVIVWLGEAKGNSDTAMDLFNNCDHEIIPYYKRPLLDLYLETLEFCRPAVRNNTAFKFLRNGLTQKFDLAMNEELRHLVSEFTK